MRANVLERYRDRLEELHSELRANIEDSVAALIEDIQPPGEHARQPAEGMDAEIALEQSEADRLREVSAALDRIDRGTFGRCIQCGVPIPADRLRAIPYTAYCIRCERDRERTM